MPFTPAQIAEVIEDAGIRRPLSTALRDAADWLNANDIPVGERANPSIELMTQLNPIPNRFAANVVVAYAHSVKVGGLTAQWRKLIDQAIAADISAATALAEAA